MSPELTIRLTIAMTLIPEASHTAVLRQLAGLLAAVPCAGSGMSRSPG